MAVTEDPVKIIEVKNGKARIRISRFSMCAHCHLADWTNETRIFEVWIDNKIGAQPGDFVRAEMPSARFLLSAFSVYGLPLVGLFTGVVIANLLHLQNLQRAEILLGGAGFVASYLFLWAFEKYAVKSKNFLPAAIKRVRVRPNLLNRIKNE